MTSGSNGSKRDRPTSLRARMGLQLSAWMKSVPFNWSFPTSAAGRSVLLALIFLVLCLCFAPILWTLWWHLSRDHSVNYRGVRISVPLRWTAKVEPQGTTLTKLPYTLPFFGKASVGFISIGRLPYPVNEPRDEISKTWQALDWNYHNGIITGPFEVGSGEKEALCMKLSIKSAPEHVGADCIIFHAKLTANFGGQTHDLDTFFQIIRDMN